MTNVTVQEALKAAIRHIEANYMLTSDEESLSDLNQCKAVLSDIEKCEPVAEIYRNLSGQLTLRTCNGDRFDMSKHIGTKFYTSQQPRDCEPVITNTNHGFVMTDRNFTYAGNGYIHDNNFDHDAALKISGDFAEGDLDKYAQMIVKQLNTKG